MEQTVYQHRQLAIKPRVMLIVFSLLPLIFFIPAVLVSVVYSSLMVEVDVHDVRLFVLGYGDHSTNDSSPKNRPSRISA